VSIESSNALFQSPTRGARLGVIPVSIARSAEKSCPLDLILHVRHGALEELSCVAIGTGGKGLLGGQHALRHSLVVATGTEKVVS